MPEAVITASVLTKKYKDFAAVAGISFEVAPGESFGLLGPNGAGKSTTMRMVGAVSTRTSGSLTVLGLDPDDFGPEIRSRLGVVPQQDNLDNELRVRENLLTYGRYFGLPRRLVAERADELLQFAQLADRAGAKVDELSTPTLNPGETYEDFLADRSAYEDFDPSVYLGGKGGGFVRLQQLATEHLLGAR